MAVRAHDEDDHGRLVLDGATVRYERGRDLVWSLPVGSIRVIGEYTTDAGPAFDDYFIVFAVACPLRLFDAPIEAAGPVLRDLGLRLGGDLRCALANRVDFASRVLWPQDLVSRSLFDFVSDRRGPGMLARAKDVFLPLVKGQVTQAVRERIEGKG